MIAKTDCLLRIFPNSEVELDYYDDYHINLTSSGLDACI